jgi:hypothetical protein
LAVHHAFDSVAQAENIEVDQEADRDFAESHVRKKLGFVDWVEGLYGFNFYYNSTFDDEIDAISDFQLVTLIDNRQRNLRCYFKTTVSQFVREARLIGAF